MTRGRPERVPEYLEYIVDAIDRAIGYVSDMDFAKFESNLPVLKRQITSALGPEPESSS
jgi:uncharacterized protein with HEPN domain